jgi:lactoylglutathione lyase
MQLGYTIVYVPSVEATLRFYETAFNIPRKFLHEGGDYGELNTGATTLAFAAHSLGAHNLPAGYVKASESSLPLGMEVALLTPDVHGAHQRALQAGATELAAPSAKPWGQVVSYVRAPDGTVVELCTPMAG